MLFAGRVSRSLLTLCLVRQSVLRGNVFNYKRKRVTVPSRVSRRLADDNNDEDDNDAIIFISLPEPRIVKVQCALVIAIDILLEINVRVLLIQRIYLRATFCTRIGKVKAAGPIIRFLLTASSLND